MNAVRSGALVALGLTLAACAGAPWTPLGLGLTDEHQVFPQATAVFGARIGAVSSHNQRVVGVDVNGWRGRTDAGSGGVAIALADNQFAGDYYGVQVTAGVNRTEPIWALDPNASEGLPPTVYGAQLGLIANFADVWGVQAGAISGWPQTHDTVGNTVRGVQIGGISGAGTFAGVQLGAIWTMTGDAYGVQAAPINLSERTYGLQIGLVNRVVSGGLQIGLLNWNQNGILPVMPLFNIGFE